VVAPAQLVAIDRFEFGRTLLQVIETIAKNGTSDLLSGEIDARRNLPVIQCFLAVQERPHRFNQLRGPDAVFAQRDAGLGRDKAHMAFRALPLFGNVLAVSQALRQQLKDLGLDRVGSMPPTRSWRQWGEGPLDSSNPTPYIIRAVVAHSKWLHRRLDERKLFFRLGKPTPVADFLARTRAKHHTLSKEPQTEGISHGLGQGRNLYLIL
jgi:hypothetical protein